MKVLRSADQGLVLQLERREQRLLLGALRLYPLIPASYHRLSKTADAAQMAAAQKLLDETLAAQKRENQKRLQALLRAAGWLERETGRCQLILSTNQVDWFLQLLNDVRVGSWLQLGCPEPNPDARPELTEDNAHYYVAMELCGAVQSLLLQALDSPA